MTKSQCFWSGSLISELFIPPGTAQSFVFTSLTFCQSHIIRCAALLHRSGAQRSVFFTVGSGGPRLGPALSPLTLRPEPSCSINNAMIVSHSTLEFISGSSISYLLTPPSFSALFGSISRFLVFGEPICSLV